MPNIMLRPYSKFLVFLTLALIALGALVKSTESGLSVPDWPTTYGHFMFTYPLNKMAGGIKYEHTHRMLASLLGLLTLGLTLWLLVRRDIPSWIKRVGIFAFVAVVLQGVLGGLTVKYYLPVWLSTLHGVLAQTLLLVLMMVAYGLSIERQQRVNDEASPRVLKFSLILMAMIYIQLIIGNLMRHAQAGLAIPDFPTMGGALIPAFNQAWFDKINAWRFAHDLAPVTGWQVFIHLFHRFWALLILLKLLWLNTMVYKECLNKPLILKTLFWLNAAVVFQIALGIATVLSQKEVYTTTGHVTMGAIVLGLSFLLVLRCAPLSWEQFKLCLKSTGE